MLGMGSRVKLQQRDVGNQALNEILPYSRLLRVVEGNPGGEVLDRLFQHDHRLGVHLGKTLPKLCESEEAGIG
jgi:hypothetical protein